MRKRRQTLSRVTTIRLMPDDHDVIERLAADKDITYAAYCRQVLLDHINQTKETIK
jgi:hypothetical protein